MMRTAAVALLALAGAVRAGPPVRLEAVFPSEAEIVVSGPGLARLELPAGVLAACRPDLSDLRVFDRGGREVAFVVDAGTPPGSERRETETAAAIVLDLGRMQSPRRDRPPWSQETYRLAAPPRTGPWTLVVETARSGFVRSVRVFGDPAAAPLVERAPLVRLGDPAVDRPRVALPAVDGPALTVVIEGEEGFYLEPSFRFERTRTLPATGQAVVPLAAAAASRAGERTVVEVERPSGIVPQLLRLTTTTPAFDRRVQVRDVVSGGADAVLGEGRVVRIASAEVVEHLDVPLAPATGRRLRVEIVDGDSPPLDGLGFAAVIRQPGLLFALPAAAAGEAAGVLRFGGGRAFRPRYDLESLLPAPGREIRGVDAAARMQLYDPARLATARLGAVRPNPTFDPQPALAFAMRPGAAVEERRFASRRTLVVPSSADGVARLALAPEDVARARGDLADLRVVGDDGRQWPFVLDRDVAPVRVALAVAPPARRGRESHFALVPPVAPLPIAAVTLEVALPFFHRRFRLEAVDDGGSAGVIASGTLVRDARRPRDSLAIVLPATRVRALVLVVSDGDDAPLPIGRAVAEVPGAALLLAAPAGRYALLLGDPEAEAPRYELAQVRDVVLALAPAPVEAGAAEDNPAFSRAARLAGGASARQAAVWIALAGAVVLLGVLTLRAARGGQPGA